MFRHERADDAKKTVKTRLVLEAIVKAEGIAAEDGDVQAKIKELAEKEGKSAEEYEKERGDYIRNDLLMDKLFAFLKANNKQIAKGV
jgi:trigger factor